ncbi:FKBP-type peptidyl-prolyl cis-trans isomerase [Nocardiopsis sp. RSe5-2]|uniref:Peptidyl-prolyl cis-trans isomerase n=1 Tax=Nocardiopsis endophytica TaxID=3018445 RepID=A0ABT4U5V0_9ACTN|nr:FKBP-type peptidyl-prolyl cis-trans isomerase [Nocardiopsis endophytica]MDA2812326.1 FKBP-type peptidyl-prolyl cis-trans isomerase [Nocardiopsis endophytica]
MALERPEIDFIDGPPPAELQVEDITIGEGAQAGHGSMLAMHYVGVSHSTGEEFDASWNRGEPLRFKLGAGQVIPGWDQGVLGMRVGGRRKLVIPPGLAYGSRGAGGVIKPNETLVFVIDLVEVA